MKTLGIVAEYNPFHNGHAFHLNQSLKKTSATHSVAIMSGHFVQRGEPALIDKWVRAKTAIDCGHNLVVELPVANAVSSAEHFAYGAISLLKAMNVIDTVSFGSESRDLDSLTALASLLARETPEFQAAIREHLSLGLSFPDARHKALLDMGFSASALKSNDILGVEYIKAAKQINAPFDFFLVKRQHVDYHSMKMVNEFASATAIRSWIQQMDFLSVRMAVPPTSYTDISILTRYQFLSDLYPYIRQTLTLGDPEALRTAHEISEGLDNRLIAAARESSTLDEFLEAAKTKRFTMARIKRTLLNILLGIAREEADRGALLTPRAIRVLAADAKGLELLKRIKEESELPVITALSKFKTEDPELLRQIDLMVRASDLYSLSRQEPMGQEYLRGPYFKK